MTRVMRLTLTLVSHNNPDKDMLTCHQDDQQPPESLRCSLLYNLMNMFAFTHMRRVQKVRRVLELSPGPASHFAFVS